MTVIAVTGGDGYIGRAVIEHLRASTRWTVRHLRRSLDGTDTSDDIIVGDITDPAACERLVEGAAVVVNVAGLVRSDDIHALTRTNVEGATNLADAARRHAVRRFVHVSTTGVYGHPGMSVDETSPYQPMNAYELSKAQADQALRRTLPDSLSIIQPSNVIGPGSPIGALRRFFGRTRAGRPVIHASAWTNYVGVEDVARVIAVATVAPEVPEVLIVNVPMTLTAFTTMVGEAIGHKGRSIELPSLSGRALMPLLGAAARRSHRWERAQALVDSTRFVTSHGDWFDEHGIRPDLRAVLASLANEYGRDPV
jgi:nucleoside-diphosphate-sugar epimerase